MLEVIQSISFFIVFGTFAWAVWQSVLMVDEKKQRRRNGITDYYDNPIEKNRSSKCMGGEDE